MSVEVEASDAYVPPPAAGTVPWDVDLNATIDWLYRHLVDLESLAGRNQTEILLLKDRVAALETSSGGTASTYQYQFSTSPPNEQL